MTDRTYHIVRGIVLLVIALSFLGRVQIRCLKRSDEPRKLLLKWVITVPVVWFLVAVVAPMALRGGNYTRFCLPLMAVCAVALIILWRRSIAELAAKPFTMLYDGGSQDWIPKPGYSIAQSRQKKGQYLEAIAEIHRQLERVPTDVEGQMLLAKIQAEDLQDLQAAELTIESLCAAVNSPCTGLPAEDRSRRTEGSGALHGVKPLIDTNPPAVNPTPRPLRPAETADHE